MLPKPWTDMTLEERKAETAAQDATAAENYAKALAQSKDEYLVEHPEARLNGPAESHEDLHKQIADLKAQLVDYQADYTVTVPR